MATPDRYKTVLEMGIELGPVPSMQQLHRAAGDAFVRDYGRAQPRSNEQVALRAYGQVPLYDKHGKPVLDSTGTPVMRPATIRRIYKSAEQQAADDLKETVRVDRELFQDKTGGLRASINAARGANDIRGRRKIMADYLKYGGSAADPSYALADTHLTAAEGHAATLSKATTAEARQEANLRLRESIVKAEEGMLEVRERVTDKEREIHGTMVQRVMLAKGLTRGVNTMVGGVFGGMVAGAENDQSGLAPIRGIAGAAESAGWGLAATMPGVGIPLAIIGSIVGSIFDGISQMATKGAKIRTEATQRGSGWVSSYARGTSTHLEGRDYVEAITNNNMDGSNTSALERTLGGFRSRYGANPIMGAYARRLREQRIKMNAHLRYFDTDVDTQMSGVFSGANGVRLTTDQANTAALLSGETGGSGKGAGSLMAALRFMYGNGGMGELQSAVRYSQRFGLTGSGQDAAQQQLAQIMMGSMAGGMSGAGAMGAFDRSGMSGVAYPRAFNFAQGVTGDIGGARDMLANPTRSLGKAMMLAYAAQKSSDVMGAMDVLDSADDTDWLKATGVNPDLQEYILRGQGHKGGEARALMASKSTANDWWGPIEMLNQVAAEMTEPARKRLGEQDKAAMDAGEIERMERINTEFEKIALSLSSIVKNMGVASAWVDGKVD